MDDACYQLKLAPPPTPYCHLPGGTPFMSTHGKTKMHAIRLRGPWDYQPLARTVVSADGTLHQEPGPLPSPGRVTMPCDWSDSLGHDFRGRVRYSRRFHQPTGLSGPGTVFLVLQQVMGTATVCLNDHPLGVATADQCPARFDITSQLLPNNRLEVEIHMPRELGDAMSPASQRQASGQAGGLVGEVRLEIVEG